MNADPDPDPAVKMNADPCGSGYTALVFTYQLGLGTDQPKANA